MPDGTAPDVRLRNFLDVEGAEDAREDANALARILHRDRVEHGREHAGVIGRRTVHPLGRLGHPAKDVAAANDDCNLDALLAHLLNRVGNLSDARGVHAIARIAH